MDFIIIYTIVLIVAAAGGHVKRGYTSLSTLADTFFYGFVVAIGLYILYETVVLT